MGKKIATGYREPVTVARGSHRIVWNKNTPQGIDGGPQAGLVAAARHVAAVGVEELAAFLSEVLIGVRAAAALCSGRVSLFDDVFERLFVIDDAGRITVSDTRDCSLGSGSASRDPAVSTPRSSDLGSTASRVHRQQLLAGGRRVGDLIFVSTGAPILLSPDAAATVEALASLAAVAIDRCGRLRAMDQLRRWVDSSSEIFPASTLPRNADNADPLLATIGKGALAVSGADLVVLYEYLEDRDDVRLPPIIVGKIHDEAVLRARSVENAHRSSAVFKVLERRQSFFATRATDDLAAAGLIEAQGGTNSFLKREGIVSSAGLILQLEGNRLGVLFLNYRIEQVFAPDFCDRMALFARIASLAIDKARLYLRSEGYALKVEALNELGRDLSSDVTRNAAEIGELIHHHIRLVVPTKNFFLCLYDAAGEHYSLPFIEDERDTRATLEPQLSEGLTGIVCKTGVPRMFSRDQQLALFAGGDARLVGSQSTMWLGAPLIVRDRVIGAVVIQEYGEHEEATLNHEHFQLLIAIASQAAIAIDNYQLLRETRLRLEELSSLLELSNAFGAGELSSRELLSSILNRLCQFALCDSSLLLLLDPGNRQRLRIEAASIGMQHYAGKYLNLKEGVAGKVVREGEPFVQNDYASWPERSYLFHPPPRRVCAVPIALHGEVIGVMTLASDHETRRLGQRETEILQRFAGPTAVAVQNARNASFKDALIHAGPHAILAVDNRGRITVANEEAARLLGHSTAELKAAPVKHFYWGGRAEAQKVQDALDKRHKIRGEEVFGRSLSGKRIPLSLAAAQLRDENGEVMGSVGIMEDLRIQSLRGRTHLLVDALREISDKEDLDAIAQLVVDRAVALLYAEAACLFLVDGTGSNLQTPVEAASAGAIASSAEARARLTAFLPSDLRRILFLPEDEPIGTLAICASCRSTVVVPIRTDTKLLALLLISSHEPGHFNEDQKLLEILASQAAVSINRVQLLRYRENTDKGLLVSANSVMISQIATSFIHEAKNALNGISLTIQDIQGDLNDEPHLTSKSKYLNRLKVVQSEVRRFDDLSRRLQSFHRQDLRPEKRHVYLNEVVARTMQLLDSALRSKNLRAQTRLDPSLSAPSQGARGNPILIDEGQVQQVLMNLVLNAIDASSERQPLLVATRNSNDYVEIRVTDHGSGMSDDAKRKIFLPYFTTKSKGVGLGLYLSRILIRENHHGTIEILGSMPGKGSSFAVRLPKTG